MPPKASPRLFTAFLLVAVAFVCTQVAAQPRHVVSLNDGWLFSRDSTFAQAVKVSVPHDFQIEQPWVAPADNEKADNSNAAANTRSRLSARGFKEMGIGYYRRTISHHPEPGMRYLLDFEGIMLVGDVYLNGRHIGGTDYGYVGFELDVTDRLHKGDNELVVRASTQQPQNSRWYTGGGLFRNVSLVTTGGQRYFGRHPLYITTRQNRYVTIGAEFVNRTKSRQSRLQFSIYDADDRLVADTTVTHRRLSPSRTQEALSPELEIAMPHLWDIDTPYLYKAVARLLNDDGSVADEYGEHFGIRTIDIGPDYGLRLNGRKVLLKGFANHHTLGALGAAAYPRAIEKRLRLLKQFGVNHVRTSHNPYSRSFIELCDKLGLLVVDELYDKWTQQHTGGRVPFMHHWSQDIAEWVRRDRNSPSVVMWSLGNELQQDASQPFNDFGVTCYKMMKPVLQRYDSTRLVTVAMHPRYRNWQTDSLPCALAMLTDVQAYNYRYMYFPGDGRRFPWMTFYQSEASTSNMGPNFFEMNRDRVIGLAYWGAIDYLGESQGWPAKGWAQGVFYIDLEPKPKAYLMKSLFSEEPVVHIAVNETGKADLMWNGIQTGNIQQSENWNRKEGTMASITVYTNCDEVELRLNGRSLGRKPNPTDPKHRNQIKWDSIAYKPGTLEARGYPSPSTPLSQPSALRQQPSTLLSPPSSHKIETTSRAVRLVATADNTRWQADGQDLQHIRIVAVDAKGRRVWTAADELQFDVKGDARIVAVTNGDISSEELNVTNHRRLWNGSATIILRSGYHPEEIVLRTTAKGYKPLTTRLATVKEPLEGE